MDFGTKQTIVGHCYEAYGHRIVGGELSRNADGDICLWNIDTTVEVKASGYQSSYGFRWSLSQIRGYEQLVSGFPFKHALYMQFAYRNVTRMNEETGKKESELSRHTTPSAVYAYLARATMWCLVFDLSIVSRLRDTSRVSTKSIMGHLGSETIDLKCRRAHDLANGGMREGLEALGLNPSDYGVLTSRVATRVSIGQARYRTNFPLVAVVPHERLEQLAEVLEDRGFATERRLE